MSNVEAEAGAGCFSIGGWNTCALKANETDREANEIDGVQKLNAFFACKYNKINSCWLIYDNNFIQIMLAMMIL